MQLLKWVSVFAFGLLVSAEQQSPPKELDIKTTYTPSDCTVKARKDDSIKVHYVRFITPTQCVDVTKPLSLSRMHTDRNAILQWQEI